MSHIILLSTHTQISIISVSPRELVILANYSPISVIRPPDIHAQTHRQTQTHTHISTIKGVPITWTEF